MSAEALEGENHNIDDVDEYDLYGDIGGSVQDDTAAEAEEQTARQSSNGEAKSSGASPSNALVEVPKNKGAALKQPLVDSASIYIGNLQWWTSDADLEALCKEHGEVVNIQTFEEASGKSRGYMLVEFDSAESANLCKQNLNEADIQGKKCVITFPSSTGGQYKQGQYGGSSARGRGRGGMGRGSYGSFSGPSMPPFGGMPGMGMMGGMGLPPGLPTPPYGMGAGMPFPSMMDGSGGQYNGDSERYSKRFRY